MFRAVGHRCLAPVGWGGGVQEELEGSHVSGALEVDLNLLWDNFQSFLLILIISVSLRKSIYWKMFIFLLLGCEKNETKKNYFSENRKKM